MGIKRYFAYVVTDLAEGFEERLNKEDKVELFSKERAVSEHGEQVFYYEIDAEEGLINPKWELK